MQCEQCGSTHFWDNRQNKRNPKAPDFKCKQCNKGVWSKDTASHAATAIAPIPSKPHAVLYEHCVDFAIKKVAPKLDAAGIPCDASTVLAAAATLFIQASKGGVVFGSKEASPQAPPPPPPPPPTVLAYDDDLPF